MIEQVAFLCIAGVTLGAAVGVVTARSVFVSALWLVLSFCGVAGLYVLLQAGFLAVIQVLVYVGAISVLILFAVMLTRDMMLEPRQTNRQWVIGIFLALALFGGLAALAYQADWPLATGQVVTSAGGTVVIGDGMSVEAAARVPGAIAVRGPDGASESYVVPSPVAALGRAFMMEYLLPFEVIGAILLVAMVGAIVIARE